MDGRDLPARDSARWSGLSGRAPRPESPPLYAYVLDADDDLAAELDVRTRVAARQLATARVLDAQAGRMRPGSVVQAAGGGPGLLILDGLLAVHTRIVDRTVTELLGAGRPAAAPAPPHRRDGGAGHDVARADRHALCAAGRGVRPAGAALAADRARAAATGGAPLRRQRCAARDLVPAAAGGAAGAACCGTWRRAGAGSSRPASASRCRSPTGCSVSWWRPSDRRSRTRWHASAEAGLVTGTPGDWHLHGKLDEHLESLIERTPRLEQHAPAGAAVCRTDRVQRMTTTGPSAAPAAAQRRPVSVLWITSGLGCDGDSVAMTAATNPSLEDLLRGALPGVPPMVLYNPMFAFETGEDFMRAWHDAEQGALDPFILVLEGSVPNEEINGDGHWAGMGTDRETGQPILTNSWIDRLAPRACGRAGAGHLRCLRRHPRHEEQPDRGDGPARLPRLALAIAARHPDREPARLPGAARQHHRDAAVPDPAPGGPGPAARPGRAGPAGQHLRTHRARGLQPRRVRERRAVRRGARRRPLPGQARAAPARW